MSNKKFDLLAIANQDLADKLNKKEQSKKPKKTSQDSKKSTNNVVTSSSPFDEDKWLALRALNILRFSFAILMLAILLLFQNDNQSSLLPYESQRVLFAVCIFAILISAILFSTLVRKRNFSFNIAVAIQLFVDVILASLIAYCYGGIESKFIAIYFIVVATGSVVLSQRTAIGLASGSVIALFYMHFYHYFSGADIQEIQYGLLATISVVLFVTAFIISYLAKQIQDNNAPKYVPDGEQPIEDYLQNEEKQALIDALTSTNGNKTKAAELLGMTFRSIRYKIKKYEIE